MEQKRNKMRKLSTSDLFRWCVENDYQVYLKPLTDSGKGACQIAVRKWGITTGGQDYIIKNNVKIISRETVGKKIYRSHADAYKDMPNVYQHLMNKYG
jgi:hypothetical protein